MLYYLSERVMGFSPGEPGGEDRSKHMRLRNDMTQERYRGILARKNQSPQTNFQLEGFWLHLARGTWIAFVLAELVIIMLTLLESLRYGLTICPWAATSCFVTPATAQALHRVGIAPASYATYNLG